MEKFISYAQEKGCEYAEIRSYDTTRNRIEIQDKDVKEISSTDSILYAVRVIFNGSEGLAYSNKDNFKELIEKTIKLAKAQNKKIQLDPLKSININLKTKCKIDLDSLSLEEKKNNVIELMKKRSEYKKVYSLSCLYMDSKTKFNFVNSEGRNILWNDARIVYRVMPFSKEGTRMESFFDAKAGHKGYELFKDESQEVMDHALKMAEKMLKSKSAKAGNYPVMIDSHLGGVFAHEAVGHGCEADLVLQGGSVMKELGKKIGSDKISIIDDKTIVGNNGWVPYDDEGVEGERTVLIKNGVLNGYLHNRQTASKLKMKPTGNARCQDAGSRAIPRMSTTMVDKGDSSYDEILKSIKDGYHLISSLGGEVNTTTGEFLFNAQYGYKIVNGELKELVKNVGLTGNILETLFNINLIGKDLKYGQGTCGKAGQWVPVSDGAPTFKIDKARVGGYG